MIQQVQSLSRKFIPNLFPKANLWQIWHFGNRFQKSLVNPCDCLAILLVRSRRDIYSFYWWLREEENRQSSIVQPTWNNNLCLETVLFISSKEETDQFLPKSNEMVPTSICFQIPPPRSLTHSHSHFSHMEHQLSPFIYVKQKKTSKWWIPRQPVSTVLPLCDCQHRLPLPYFFTLLIYPQGERVLGSS